jgi:hypothetical protein
MSKHDGVKADMEACRSGWMNGKVGEWKTENLIHDVLNVSRVTIKLSRLKKNAAHYEDDDFRDYITLFSLAILFLVSISWWGMMSQRTNMSPLWSVQASLLHYIYSSLIKCDYGLDTKRGRASLSTTNMSPISR